MKIEESIITKVLNNEASVEEAGKVAEWFATDEGRACLSARMAKETEEMTEEKIGEWVPYAIPEERMKERFLGQVAREKKSPRYTRWLVAAAVIPLFFLSVSFALLARRVGLFAETEYAELVVPCGEQMRVVLQDGTIVHLNSDSRFKYPKKFGLFSRKVELSGEAYFEVAKEGSRSFFVDLKNINVKVTGTKFNVKAYSQETNLWVTLDEGEVALQDQNGKEYPMRPGESAEYDRRSGVCQISKPDDMESISAWRTNSLNFYLTPLKDIVKVLNRQYDVHFIIPDSSLLDCRFTLSTSKVNVLDVLHDLEAVSHISFRETEEGVFEIKSKE